MTVYPAAQAARIRLSVALGFWPQGHELLATIDGAAAAAAAAGRAAGRAEGGYAAPTLFVRAGLDEGLLSVSLSNLLYMENPYSYKKCQ